MSADEWKLRDHEAMVKHVAFIEGNMPDEWAYYPEEYGMEEVTDEPDSY